MMMSPERLMQEMQQQVNRVMVPFLNQPTLEAEKLAEKSLKILMKEYREAAKDHRCEELYWEQGIPATVELIGKETEMIWKGHVAQDYRGGIGIRPGKEAYKTFLSCSEGCCRMLEYAVDLYNDKYDKRRVPLYRSLQRIARECLNVQGYDVKKPLLGKETIVEIPVPADVQKTMTKRVDNSMKLEQAVEKHNSGLTGILRNGLTGNNSAKVIRKNEAKIPPIQTAAPHHHAPKTPINNNMPSKQRGVFGGGGAFGGGSGRKKPE